MIGDVWLTSDTCNFGLDTYFINKYYIQELKKQKFIKLHRIIIEPMPEVILPMYRVIGEKSTVCYVRVAYDINQYILRTTEKEKSLQLLDLHHQGMMVLCDTLKWDKTPFTQIRDKLIASDFKIERHFKKKHNSTKEKIYAWLSLSYEMKSTKCYVNFEKEGTIFCSVLIFDAKQDFDYKILMNLFLNDFYWESNDIFVITDYNKEIFFKCSYTNCQSEIAYDLSKKSKEQIEEKLKTWKHTTTTSEFKDLYTKYWHPVFIEYTNKKLGIKT